MASNDQGGNRDRGARGRAAEAFEAARERTASAYEAARRSAGDVTRQASEQSRLSGRRGGRRLRGRRPARRFAAGQRARG